MVLKLVVVIELSPLPVVLGVMESVGEACMALPKVAEGSTFKSGVLLSVSVEDALLLR